MNEILGKIKLARKTLTSLTSFFIISVFKRLSVVIHCDKEFEICLTGLEFEFRLAYLVRI